MTEHGASERHKGIGWSIGFGLERVAWPAMRWPAFTGVFVAIVVALAAYGSRDVTFNENLTQVFAGDTGAYRDYQRVTEDFVDPENESIVLVEGPAIATPQGLTKLMEFHLELQLIDGVESVFSPFSLRHAPDANGDAAPLIADASAGLSPQLVEEIRAHPLLGERLLSADAGAMIFVVTPSEPKAPLDTFRQIKRAIDAAAEQHLAGTGLTETVTGFPAIRAGILDIMIRDQLVLNIAGAFIGILMSLIIFRSLIAAVVTAVPAIIGGFLVIGWSGLLGVPMTAMSNVIPALVMIVGFADGIHLTHAWRFHRDKGASVAEAERLAQKDVGAACILTSLTTSISFLSLTISDVAVVRGFGWTGAISMLVGVSAMLTCHALATRLLGRFWQRPKRGVPDLFKPLSPVSAAITQFAVRYARPIAVCVAGLLVVLVMSYFNLKPDHSIHEHLPKSHPANAALSRIDTVFGGAYPIQIIVPLNGMSATSPEALAKIKAVHQAVAAIDGFAEPLSLWTLADWLGGETAGDKVAGVLDQLAPTARQRFVGSTGAAMVSGAVRDQPTHVMEPFIEQIEHAAKTAGGNDVTVTGVTVLTTREGTRTISSLNGSLTIAIIADLIVMMIAFRNWAIGALAVFSNTLPVLATCACLLLSGRGMQFSTVIAMTVAFGVTVDETTHFLNHFLKERGHSLGERLVQTSRHIGPVLIGTTVILLCGLSTTMTSGLPTMVLFGLITGATLVFALACDLLVIPALIAGPARRWFGGEAKVRRAAPRTAT